MPYGTFVANPSQLACWERVLEAYCRHVGIDTHAERELVAEKIIALSGTGLIGEEQLLAELILPRTQGPSTSRTR